MTQTLLEPDSPSQMGWKSPQFSLTSRKGLPSPSMPLRYVILLSEVGGRSLRAPLVMRVEQGEELLLGEADRLNLHVAAATLAGLIEELSDEIVVLVEHYAQLGADDVIGEGRRLKAELEHLFAA